MMDVHVASLRWLLAAAVIALLPLVGCTLSGEIDLDEVLDGEGLDELAVTITPAPTGVPESDTEARGLVVAPDEVVIYVGEELFMELTLTDPGITRIVAGQLPMTAEFAEDQFGAVVHWMPQLTDVGQHDFIFLIVDSAEANLVLGTTSISVSVLPRFGLIEYGF
jgi:hypothetical protein